jgi:aminopeptidase N
MYLNKKYLSRFDALRDLRSPENPPVRVDYPLGDPPPADLFGWAVYDNGAGLAHALRREMGDEAFFAGLRSYFERYGGAAATQEQFRGAMEEACGCSLDKIMRSWLE